MLGIVDGGLMKSESREPRLTLGDEDDGDDDDNKSDDSDAEAADLPS